MAFIGLDLGGTKLAGGLFDETGNLLERRVAPLEKRSGPEVGGLMVNMIKDLQAEGGRRKRETEALGVSVPGIAHPASGRVWAPNIPGWEDYPLRDELEALSRSSGEKVAIDSDRACSMMGERWKGAAQGCRNAIFLAVGTGIGAGLLVDGRIVRGSQDIAGATGWMALDTQFRQEYVLCGCFEYHASGNGIAKVARAQIAGARGYRGPMAGIPPEALTAHHVFDAYDQGDPLAIETLRGAIRAWGAATANFVSLFNPELIVFGGGVFGPGGRFLEDIRREAAKWAQPISMRSVRLEISSLGSDAALYGAGFLALSNGRSFSPREA
jgi:glucokinase